jgi:hypothetical protein
VHPDLTLLVAAERQAHLDVSRGGSHAPEDDAVRIAAQSRRDAELEQYGLRRHDDGVLAPLRPA